MKRSTTLGSSALDTVDYLGESLANFFGITTPKYQFEINYHNNIMQEVSIIYNNNNNKTINVLTAMISAVLEK